MPIFIDDWEIKDEEVFAEMQYHPSSNAQEAMEKAGRALVIRRLLLMRAQELHINSPSENENPIVKEDFLISRVLEHDIKTPEADDEACLRYYNSNQAVFKDTGGNYVAFEHVKPTIAAFLKDVSWQTAVSQYLQILVGKSDIKGIDLEGVTGPLVR